MMRGKLKTAVFCALLFGASTGAMSKISTLESKLNAFADEHQWTLYHRAQDLVITEQFTITGETFPGGLDKSLKYLFFTHQDRMQAGMGYCVDDLRKTAWIFDFGWLEAAIARQQANGVAPRASRDFVSCTGYKSGEILRGELPRHSLPGGVTGDD